VSRLRIYPENAPSTPRLETRNPAAIAEALAGIGVQFERWQAAAELAPGSSADAVLAAYRVDIDRLMLAGGYQAVDVISLGLASEGPTQAERESLRAKFLNEHTHAEDEVRFFVAGSGLFTIHAQAEVFEVECVRGDLINLPAGTKHWFDMGAEPSFIAIRIFTNPAGWVANFTGTDIATRFPRYVRELAG
jgi:1,2-dihydroxy-3-keto-5-methylthiopentene dioxygenase